MKIQHFFDKDTNTFTYIVSDEETKKCIVIDPVQDYDMAAGRTNMTSADKVIQSIKDQGLTLEWVLETHIHADHLTAATYIKEQLGGKIGIGAHIKEVLELWVPRFDTAKDTPFDGSQFDILLEDGQRLQFGNSEIEVLHTPGHTPACCTYKIEDALFVGDTIFMPKRGTARCDFPGGSAHDMYQSLQRILSYPDDTRIFVCHDYPGADESEACETTVGEQKAHNKMIHSGVTEEEYTKVRSTRDATLAAPRLILPSIQVNMRAGDLGTPAENGIRYLKLPLNQM